MPVLDYNSIRRSRFSRRIWRMGLRIVAWLVMAAAITSIGIIASVWGRPDLTVGVGTVLVLKTNTEKMVAMILCAGLVVSGLALNISWARRRRGKVVQENPTMEQVRWLKLQRLRHVARRALMVAGVLLALALLWAEIHGWRQAHAVQAIRDAGGSVDISSGFAPGLLQHAFGDVTDVYMNGTRSTDALLALAPRFTLLQTLHLENSAVTDGGLVYVGKLQALELLDLGHTGVTDAGLVHLKSLHELRSLNLSDTAVTDAGLAHLQELPNLMTLHLENTRITDTGLRQLGKMHHLELLALGKTAITDAGLPALHSLTRLRALGIHDTAITAMGRAALKSHFPRLYIY